jgi:hypothetical protein
MAARFSCAAFLHPGMRQESVGQFNGPSIIQVHYRQFAGEPSSLDANTVALAEILWFGRPKGPTLLQRTFLTRENAADCETTLAITFRL